MGLRQNQVAVAFADRGRSIRAASVRKRLQAAEDRSSLDWAVVESR